MAWSFSDRNRLAVSQGFSSYRDKRTAFSHINNAKEAQYVKEAANAKLGRPPDAKITAHSSTAVKAVRSYNDLIKNRTGTWHDFLVTTIEYWDETQWENTRTEETTP
ncbi:MAG: hypothetical protein ACREHG_04330 [Candidatus Saccharimonadales bacterium]